MRAVLDLGHIPSGMEIFPAADVEQFDYIKKVIDECDYCVLIIGARYGSVDAAGVSFTEKEYDYAVAQRKTVLAFIHGAPGSIAVDKADTDQILGQRLKAFRGKVSTGRLVSFWKTVEELELKVVKALARAFTDAPGVGWIRGNAAASEQLLAQVNDLHNTVEKLRAENKDLVERTKPRVDGIAALSDTFEVRYSYREESTLKRCNGTIPLTWAEIFSACGPNFLQPNYVKAISSSVEKYLMENKGVSRDSLSLFDTDENQIKIQLIALGLIEIEDNTARDGQVPKLASLTPDGRRQLLELLAVKGTTSN